MSSSNGGDAERQPLLGNGATGGEGSILSRFLAWINPKRLVATVVSILFIVGVAVSIANHERHNKEISRDPHKAALAILDRHPLIDTHIDLPWLIRDVYRNNATAVDLENKTYGHVDIPRLRAGRVGGFFWSVYTSCPKYIIPGGLGFIEPTNSVRDTLEQIDIATALIEKFPKTFALATTVSEIRYAIASGKIASLIGIEGGHQLGNSIAALRQFYRLGVRYVTLTHACHNAFADSAGIFEKPVPLHNGLSSLGRSLIQEMNRIGMIVDISHTSDATAIQAINISEAPVIWSHSSARSIWNVPRNVPDDILRMIGTGPGKKDGVVQVNFAPFFVAAEGNATVYAVADHVDWIGRIAGRKHVGLGSDYDGIESVPVGLEDVSAYPNLFAELYKRGWSARELDGLAGENLLRVMEGVEATAWRLRNEPRVEVIYERRTDMSCEPFCV